MKEEDYLTATLVLNEDKNISTCELKEIEGMQQTEKKFSLGYTIVKRNGMLVPFRKDRIFNALEAAFRDTKKIESSLTLSDSIRQIIELITDLVVDEAVKLAKLGALLTVEGIQDIVEVKLMETGHHDVARDYIIYRAQHKKLRADSPGAVKILRRDGISFVRFNPMKIASTIEKSFRDTLKMTGPTPEEVIESVNVLSHKIIDYVMTIIGKGEIVSIEMIQNAIEKHLMAEGYFEVAKDYILYRSERARVKEKSKEKEDESVLLEEPLTEEEHKVQAFTVIRKDGTSYKITKNQLKKKISCASKGYDSLLPAEELVEQAIANFYDGVKDHEVDLAIIMAARAKVEIEPNYTYVAANLLLDILYRETMGVEASHPNLNKIYRDYFKEYFRVAVSVERLDPTLLSFDLDKLAQALDITRDRQFTYLGLQTLYDRYFIHQDGRRLETPQIFWMRVAMGLSINEGKQKEKRAIEFYTILSKFLYTSATPTLFNSGTPHSQLSSCYLSTVMDDLHHIFKVISDDAQLSKWAGGLGNDWTNIRATGSLIKGTNGKSQGVIPFMKVANDTAVAVNQCFSPETLIYTAEGIKPISSVSIKDLVLGSSGTYREVTEKFVYNQKGPMVSLFVKHSIDPISVTAGHPFYAIRIPSEQTHTQTLNTEGKIKCEWVEAGQLKQGDYIAQTIPKETVHAVDIDEEDARLYGILLGAGQLAKKETQWGICGNPKTDEYLAFVRHYLTKRGMHFWENNRDETYMHIHWAEGRGAVREGTTDHIIDKSLASLPFGYEDLYDHKGQKRISPRLSHLLRPQTLALIQGLLETQGTGKQEITFCNASRALAEGIRYQFLRLGLPTSASFNNLSYDVHIPATPEIACLVNCTSTAEQDWLIVGDHIFTPLKERVSIDPTPFVCDLKVEGDESYMTTAGLAHNGGKRKGAMCSYLETWHLDIEDFLELRKNTGDERRRTHDMNTANWIPDLFMKRVLENGSWTLFSPNDVPDLHHLYGKAFEERYVEYEKLAEQGKIALFKKLDAVALWRKMLGMLYETGHPWITFKDPSNIRSPQDHAGVVHSSNLCTEILLNTSADETAVCNLGSVNLAAHTNENGIDRELLASTIRIAIRMLDNVIDINFYPTEEAKKANLRHRAIGLGLMGFQDALYKLGISYASHKAVEFADESMELLSYYAILASTELAKERGTYSSYKGSKWSRGILPIDSIELLRQERGADYVEIDTTSFLDWNPVRESIKKYGMRNCNTMAIAPTATISNIIGVTQSIEPMYKHLFVKSNLSGEFTVLNNYLVEKLKELKLWDSEMIDDLKYFDGSILEIERIPNEVKKLFLTAFEIEPDWLMECAARRQKWIDMGQSLNLYLAEPSGKKLHQMYVMAWKKGLKTTYYLRSLGATHVEKSTTDINKRGLQPRWMKSESATSRIVIEREKPIACSLDETCESCQ